jgi:hypothetical protein
MPPNFPNGGADAGSKASCASSGEVEISRFIAGLPGGGGPMARDGHQQQGMAVNDNKEDTRAQR